jgi:integrase
MSRAELEAELKRLTAIQPQPRAISGEQDHPAADARAAPPSHSRRAREKNIVFLTDEELRALFRVIKDAGGKHSIRDTAIFRVAYHRGLRRSELGLLQLSDFRDREGRLYSTRLKGSNSGEDRLFDEELRAVRAWIKQRGSAPGPLFPSRQSGPITGRRLDQLMKRYCALAGIPAEKAHMHSLKHSCGTHFYRRTGDLLAVKAHLGHRNIQNTIKYITIADPRRDEIAEKNRDWK